MPSLPPSSSLIIRQLLNCIDLYAPEAFKVNLVIHLEDPKKDGLIF